jgi:hypothetical protein
MIIVEREDEWMKEIITIEEAKQTLRINYNYGWIFLKLFTYTKDCTRIG